MMVVREKIRLKSTALEDHLKSTTLVADQIQARVFCLDFPDVPFLAEIIPFFTVASQRKKKSTVLILYSSHQGCTNAGREVALATNFCTVAPNTCGFSVWTLLHVALLAPRILIWFLGFQKSCVSLF
jgi:hypothetical protein